MRILLAGASPERLSPKARRLLKQQASLADAVIAVDGGLSLLKSARVKPTLYVGDLDSARAVPAKLPAVFLPPKKEFSDLRVALEIAHSLGATRIQAWGVLGARLDHHHAALEDLTDATWCRELSAHASGTELHWVRPGKALTVSGFDREAHVSVFPLRGPARGVKSTGLEYPLANETLHPGSRGLSNRPKAAKISVSLKSGQALVILTHA